MNVTGILYKRHSTVDDNAARIALSNLHAILQFIIIM